MDAASRNRIRYEFGVFLDGQLRQRGWTKRELSRRTNVDESQISKWTRGLRVPDVPHCRALAEVFAIPVNEVLITAGYATPEERQDVDHPVRARVIALVQRLDPEILEIHAALMERYLAVAEAEK